MEMLCMWENMKRSCNKFIKEIQFPACTRHSASHALKKKKNNINNGHHNSPALNAVVYIEGREKGVEGKRRRVLRWKIYVPLLACY